MKTLQITKLTIYDLYRHLFAPALRRMPYADSMTGALLATPLLFNVIYFYLRHQNIHVCRPCRG
jgi:hypothetical protein